MAEGTNTEGEKVETKEETQQEQQPAETGDETVEVAEEQTAPKEMRAVVLTGFGGLKYVKVQKKPEPTAGEGEVLIRVKACGLNFLDVMVRIGAIDSPPKTPVILGFECSGEVEAIGEGVADFQIGDRVAALTEYKAWAECAAVPTKFVYKIPAEMTYQDAAAMLMNFVVAYSLVFDTGCIRQGQTVLIHSAGGGVGQAVSQLCKAIPEVTLIGTASKHKHESMKDSFTHLIEHGGDYVQEIKKIAPSGVDVVLDCLGGDDANKGYGLLKPMGRYILYGSANIVTGETKSFFSAAKSWWQLDKVSPMKLFDENRSVSGFHLRHLLYKQNGHEYVRNVVEKVMKLWQDGQIKPVVDSTWAFEDIPEAMQKLHERKNVGKITIDPAMEPKPKPVPESKKEKEKGKDKGKDKEKEKENSNQSPKPEEKAEEKADGDKADKEEKETPADAS